MNNLPSDHPYRKSAEYRAMHPNLQNRIAVLGKHHIVKSPDGHCVVGPKPSGIAVGASENYKQIAICFNDTPHCKNSLVIMERTDAEMLAALLDVLLNQ